jgi:diaminopropionate ammonia-lyase
MIGLAVGEVSTMAWDILRTGSDVAVSIDDAPAREAMRRAARPSGTDPRIVMGETGAAGLAACLEACRNPEIASMLGLSSGSRILLFNTEGAVDPESYAKIIDRAGET